MMYGNDLFHCCEKAVIKDLHARSLPRLPNYGSTLDGSIQSINLYEWRNHMSSVRVEHPRSSDGLHVDTFWLCEASPVLHEFRQFWGSQEIQDKNGDILGEEETAALASGQCPRCP